MSFMYAMEESSHKDLRYDKIINYFTTYQDEKMIDGQKRLVYCPYHEEYHNPDTGRSHTHGMIYKMNLLYICTLCTPWIHFQQKSDLLLHVAHHNNTWQCPACKSIMTTIDALKKHLGEVHSKLVVGCDKLLLQKTKHFRNELECFLNGLDSNDMIAIETLLALRNI